jgi:GTP-binding protein
MKFLDEAKVFLAAGDGGAGCIGFHREKFVEFGGPDGGDGGRGGHVVFEVADNLNTLIDYRYKQHFKAEKGGHGMGKNRHGANGKDVVLYVPPGTQVMSEDGEHVLADLVTPGQRVILLRGGRGGKGNAFFKSSTHQAPRFAQPGEPGGEAWVWLRLKLIADAGIIGLPNAGKSTFLSVISGAKPKIADYPFTTLYPGLGMATIDGDNILFADIPGLIEGAHEGRGLGDKFLKHVERCAVLLHLIDATSTNPSEDWRTIRQECALYSDGLASTPEIVALNKIDALDGQVLQEVRAQFVAATGVEPLLVSAVTRTGLEDVLRAVAVPVRLNRAIAQQPSEEDSI